MPYKISEVAAVSGMSERMLRYYDKIGLLKPSNVTDAGYRLYSDEDLDRLLHIAYLKELGFSLSEIRRMFESGLERRQLLLAQEQLLLNRIEKLKAMAKAVRRTIDSLENIDYINKREIFTSFDMAEIERREAEYKAEFTRKLGRECGARTSGYTQDDWTIVMSKAGDIFTSIGPLVHLSPSDPLVQEKIGELREFIEATFFPCSAETFRNLADLYAHDPTFRSYVEQYGHDLPEFVREAIYIYCGDVRD